MILCRNRPYDLMEFVQTRIDYHFADIQLLESALKAAHRDRENENTDDGNRGLARIGLLAIEMAETYNAIVVENLTISMSSMIHIADSVLTFIDDANSREHWWKNKKSRAKLCELLGIGSCIKQSIRQGDLSPSTAVLDHALSALFGAVWLDCENQGKSANETRNTISKVLHHINASVNEPRFAVNDWNRTLVEKNSLWNPLAEETTGGLMQEDCVNITTDDTHSLALDSIVNIYVDELGYADNQSFLDNFPMFGNQNLFMGNFQGTVDLIRLRKRRLNLWQFRDKVRLHSPLSRLWM
jgi:dsRNA-specific ribonuclease